ncbi:MAG: hypothetical protein HY883_06985 [Deltaproteobacteria bacterium]|nr:hypothetical protein [Deltaproteobacteria bacterium]
MKVPTLRFTQWQRWDGRNSLEGNDLPGVYLLAHFSKVQSGRAKRLCGEIVYIGETCANTLKGRWQQFERSAFKGKGGHSGGWTYRQKIKGKKNILYVAYFPVDCRLNEEVRPIYIRHIERRLIWDFTRKWGKPPRCNTK